MVYLGVWGDRFLHFASRGCREIRSQGTTSSVSSSPQTGSAFSVVWVEAVFLVGSFAGCGGGFFVFVASQFDSFLVDYDFSHPSLFVIAPVNSGSTRFVVRMAFLVFGVFGVCDFAQVFDAVVIAVAVDVVELQCWPGAVMNEPGEAMSVVAFSVEADASVWVFVFD